MRFINIFSADDLNQPGCGMSNKQARANTTIEEAIKYEFLINDNK
jgi:hypothetical protein